VSVLVLMVCLFCCMGIFQRTVRVIARLWYKNCPIAALLQLFAIRLLLQGCDGIEVCECRCAGDMFEVAVLEDSERHGADALPWCDVDALNEVKLLTLMESCTVLSACRMASRGIVCTILCHAYMCNLIPASAGCVG
jgi:hypothetical protein